ncbi:hypothetical protein IE81DRAFT_338943 [Ceraceosorus guamensis]|uniref:N-acetyltransferase domain-containing protein n=1 Tax=Ceraceosorus guamensis TaxID=1522189 RepID=A0A316WFV9_9BASI|nr:hypothetical protein IE81DRAFT_338943 [Ceraceosorus guamensis]PWN46115.1 hypothetical protein IE81DRAFT_338943 [Ceraceosorus guamensis]
MSSGQPRIRPMEARDVDEAGWIFAHGFVPMMQNVFPSGITEGLIRARSARIGHSLQEVRSGKRPKGRMEVVVRDAVDAAGKVAEEEQLLGFVEWRIVDVEMEKQQRVEAQDAEEQDDALDRIMAMYPSDARMDLYKNMISNFDKAHHQYAGKFRHAYVEILGVSPRHARTGAGSLVLRHIAEASAKEDVHNIFLLAAPTPSAVPFYKKHGYKELAKVTSEGLEDSIAMLWTRPEAAS